MLDIIGVEKTFNPGTVNEKIALNGINLHLDEGDFVTVIGGNGAGKSTMLNMIAGVYPVDCGNIIIGACPIYVLVGCVFGTNGGAKICALSFLKRNA